MAAQPNPYASPAKSSGPKPRARRTLVSMKWHGALGLLGVPAFGWCALNHICMGGHMADPPYPWWHFALDATWVVPFFAASLTGFLSGGRCVLGSLLLLLLLASRLLAGSGGAMLLMIFELPLLLGVLGVALSTFALRKSRP